jgi:hypothetical protein
MWNLLKRIKPLLSGPWLMMDDFNECMWQEEHFLGKRNVKHMRDFREVLLYCNLHDMGFIGRPWTFDNKHDGKNYVRVKLDRAVLDNDWINLFPNYQVRHLVSSRSDYCPVLVTLASTVSMVRPPPIHRYETYWEREATLGEEINIAWSMHKKPNDLLEMLPTTFRV